MASQTTASVNFARKKQKNKKSDHLRAKSEGVQIGQSQSVKRLRSPKPQPGSTKMHYNRYHASSIYTLNHLLPLSLNFSNKDFILVLLQRKLRTYYKKKTQSFFFLTILFFYN